MKYLYADNFKGFRDTYIPLVDINFLVGENSTGKTSVLELLRIFSKSQLWFGPNPAGSYEGFGHFKEIVSAHSDDRSYFRVGLIEEGSPSALGVLFTYTERGGLPNLSRFTCYFGDKIIALRFEGGKLYANVTEVSTTTTAEEMRALMSRWVRSHGESAVEWSEVTPPSDVQSWSWSQMPLFVMLTSPAFLQSETPAMRLPSLISSVVWIGPMRSRARRTYDAPGTSFSPTGLHTPYVIRRMLSSSDEAQRFSEFMKRVGKASGLFESITMKAYGDEQDQTAPFEVDAILDDKALNLSWMGYGVSQSLPILVELLDRPPRSWFAIQQPEVHLHPRAQAALGDVFFEMATRDRKSFVIETHSDFTIDRFRMNYRKKTPHNKPQSQVLFFERKDKRNTVTSLLIGSRGELPSDQPRGYREFFVKEQMDLIGV